MAGKVKNYYVTVFDNQNKSATVVHKKFFSSGEANKFMAEMKEKYPTPEFTVLREYF